ncbi:sortase-dependent protein [Streptomyces sp. NPDC094143]|uniref:sortase-dependent protein n=1 Tax=Streptomyces sp. NPDC094143 TaxID=3155310 RepID=UPI003328BF61
MRFTFRTGLASLAITGTALMAGAGVASADGTPTPVPSTADRAGNPTPVASAPGRDRSPASPVPGQVSVVPKGGADTGENAGSTSYGGMIGGSVAVLAAGGAGVYFLHRRRTTGA